MSRKIYYIWEYIYKCKYSRDWEQWRRCRGWGTLNLCARALRNFSPIGLYLYRTRKGRRRRNRVKHVRLPTHHTRVRHVGPVQVRRRRPPQYLYIYIYVWVYMPPLQYGHVKIEKITSTLESQVWRWIVIFRSFYNLNGQSR